MLKYLHKINLSGGVILLALMFICSVSASAEIVSKTSFTAVSGDLDNNIKYASAKGGGTAAPAVSGGEIRLYQISGPNKYGGTITISANNNFVIKSVKIGSSMASTIAYTIDNSTTLSTSSSISANGTYSVNNISASSVTFYCLGTDKNSRIYVNSLEVEYTSADPTAPSISVDYGSIDLGTCNINEPTTKKITVTGENLNERIAISMEGDNVFSADKEELAAAGGELTITYAPTEEGSNTAKFTLTSGETTATIEITAKARDLSTVGNGTEEMPFTLEYVNELNNSKSGNYWVKGTIAGYYNNGKIDTSNDTNLALQDAGSDIVVPLALTGDFRTNFGVKTNPQHVGRVILVSGSLETYFNIPGIKSPTDIKFVTDKFNISASKWATYYTDKAFTMPENATGYIVVPSGSDANVVSLEKTYNAGDAVPANTPILINGEAGEYTYYVTTTTATADSRNMLRGQLEAGTITPEENGDYLYYKLSYNSDGNTLGFYWGAENGGVFGLTGSNRAYLVVENTGSNAKAVKVNWPGDETTGISDIRTDKANDEAIYNIAGQRVTKATKGIYIKNGKKFIAK